MSDYFKFFSRIAVGLMQRQETSTLIQKLINEAVALVETDFGYIHLVDEQTQRLEIIAASNADLDSINKMRLAKGEGVAGHCWEQGECVVVNDYLNWDGRINHNSLTTMRSVICTPMIRNGSVYGVLGLGSLSLREFGAKEMEAMSHFADVAAVALDNTGLIEQITSELKRSSALTDEVRRSAISYRALLEKTQTRLHQSEALVHISSLINSDTDLDRLAAYVQESSLAALEYDDLRLLRIYDGPGSGKQLLCNDLDSGSADYSWQSANDAIARLLQEVSNSPNSETSAQITSIGHPIELDQNPALVFLIHGETSAWGVIIASLQTPDQKFDDEDRKVLGAITNQFSLAVKQRSLIARTEYQANHDELTKLANRRLFKQRVNEMLSQSQAAESSLSLLVFDLDGFKEVNDDHGHQTGDLLLGTVSERLVAGVNTCSTVARLGGDEFAILLNTDQEIDNDCDVANGLLQTLQEPICISGLQLAISASVGISRYPEHGKSYSDLMVAADAAMYKVKNSGKSGFKLYTTKRPRVADERSASEAPNISNQR